MKIFNTCVLMLILAANLYAGKPGGCSNVPISVTFVAPNAAPAAIYNDDPTKPYTGGTNTQIHTCDGGNGGGSFDGTMATPSKRTIMMRFPAAIAGSLIYGGPATFAQGNPIATKPFMNIHNLTGQNVVQPGVTSTYYTRVTFAFDGPDRTPYRLHIYPDDSSCPGDYPCAPDLHGPGYGPIGNTPVQTAWVKVTHIARNPSQAWSISNTDSWILEGDLANAPDTEIGRATLFLQGAPAGNGHYGQYSMPFKIIVTALAKVTY